MYYGADGSELKKFNTRDGHGLSLLGSKGILTGLITGENTTINTNRAKKLGITIIEQGIKDKLACVSKILEIHGLGWNQLAYIGDDLNDLEVLRRAGWSAAPSDAEPVILNEVKYICKRPGGRGCVREAADYLLQGRVPSTT
jgi:YrbI family 3-deoxy-D-manno-octulosonate 8-phosphate phosphatase